MKIMAFTVNKKAFCVLEFAETESIVTVQRRFRIMYHTEPPTDKTIREWYMNSFRSAQVATLLEFMKWTAMAQWLRCRATNRKVAGSIPDGVIGIFLT